MFQESVRNKINRSVIESFHSSSVSFYFTKPVSSCRSFAVVTPISGLTAGHLTQTVYLSLRGIWMESNFKLITQILY